MIFSLIIIVIGVLIVGSLLGYQVWALQHNKINKDIINPIEENPLSYINIARTSYFVRQKTERLWHFMILYGTSMLMWTIRLIENKLRAIVYKTYDKLHGVRSSAQKAREISKKEHTTFFHALETVRKEEIEK